MDPTLRNGIFSTILTLLLLIGIALFMLNFYPSMEGSLSSFKTYNETVASTLSGNLAPNDEMVHKNGTHIQLKAIINETEVIAIRDPIPHFTDSSDSLYILFAKYKQPLKLALSLLIGGVIGFIISQFLHSESRIFMLIAKENAEPKIAFTPLALRISIPMLVWIYIIHAPFTAVYNFIWNDNTSPDTWKSRMTNFVHIGMHNFH